jgi:predicted small lipoprotein YifL
MGFAVRACGALHVLVAAFALSFALAGCGLRTPVRPPEDTAPVIPGAATAIREDDGVLVRWKRAERSADGMPLEDLAAFVVERRLAGEEEWKRVATVDVIDQEKIRRRKDFSWRDSDPAAGTGEYRVRAVNADGQEGPAVPADAPQN